MSATTHGDPFLSPWQTNPTAGTPEDAAAQLDMARDLTFNRDDDVTAALGFNECRRCEVELEAWYGAQVPGFMCPKCRTVYTPLDEEGEE